MNTQNDDELWSQIKAGDQVAFQLLYKRYVSKLFKEISRRITDIYTAEDLTQDIFLSLWEKRDSYQPIGDVYPYLYGMAINRVLNYYRQHKLQKQFVEIWENLPEDIAGLTELSLAFKQAHNQELESLLDVTLRSLPTRMREVYRLRYERQLSISEIAEELSTSPNTIHNQLKDVRKRFTNALKNTSYFFFF